MFLHASPTSPPPGVSHLIAAALSPSAQPGAKLIRSLRAALELPAEPERDLLSASGFTTLTQLSVQHYSLTFTLPRHYPERAVSAAVQGVLKDAHISFHDAGDLWRVVIITQLRLTQVHGPVRESGWSAQLYGQREQPLRRVWSLHWNGQFRGLMELNEDRVMIHAAQQPPETLVQDLLRPYDVTSSSFFWFTDFTRSVPA